MIRRIISYSIIGMGLLLCGYGGFTWFQQVSLAKTYVPSKVEEKSKNNQSEQLTEDPGKTKINVNDGIVYPTRPAIGESLGTLIIPRLKIELPLNEGTDEEQLKKGIGHYHTSVLPGERDNSVLAGHRETAFRKLGEMKNGDEFIVDNKIGTFTFKVSRSWITDKDDRSVIVSLGKPKLSVITCYPFFFVGPAPKRYIVQSDLVKVELK